MCEVQVRREELRNLLRLGREVSLVDVEALIQAEPAVLIIDNVEDSPILLSIQNDCSDEVILHLLRSTFPGNHGSKDNVYWKVLLLAALDVSGHTSFAVVQELLQTFPQWVARKEFCEPLGHVFYWALNTRPDIARFMVGQHPEVAAVQSRTLGYPIHAAVKLRDRITTEVLLEAYPQGLYLKDSEGRLPLHHVLTSEPRVDMDLFLFLADQLPPDFFQALDENTGHLFLHQIARSDIKFSMEARLTEAIIDRYPEATMVQDTNGNLPLHLALDEDGEAYAFTSTLIKMAQNSLFVANHRGMLPIHIAVSKFMVASAHDIITSVPQVLLESDGGGQTPLHVMLEHDMFDKALAELMIQQHPEVLMMRDSTGRVPLHYAVNDCQYYEDIDWIETVELLTAACPAAGSVHDHLGKTPIHYAVSTGMPYSVMEILFCNCAEALVVSDIDGTLPFMYAASAVYRNPDHSSLDAIYMLIRHEPCQVLRPTGATLEQVEECPLQKRRRLENDDKI